MSWSLLAPPVPLDANLDQLRHCYGVKVMTLAGAVKATSPLRRSAIEDQARAYSVEPCGASGWQSER